MLTVTASGIPSIFPDAATGAKDVIIRNHGIPKPGNRRDSIKDGGFGEENVQAYSKGFEAVQALEQGKISAVLIDNEPAKVFVSQVEGLVILDEAFVEEEYALCVKKGNTELLEKINASLAKLKESGKFDEIIDKYITAE